MLPDLYIVHTFLPPKKGQPLNNACPHHVHYLEVLTSDVGGKGGGSLDRSIHV